jgi:ATPase subunit of ABC transporter with duplicated ATPase domains
VQAVVAADVELMELREEEADINRKLAAASLEEEADEGAAGDGPIPAQGFDADAASERLNEIYERMQELGSASAESRASKILHGLGASTHGLDTSNCLIYSILMQGCSLSPRNYPR